MLVRIHRIQNSHEFDRSICSFCIETGMKRRQNPTIREITWFYYSRNFAEHKGMYYF